MNPARALLTGAGGVLVIGLVLLVLAGASDHRATQFSLEVPAAGPAAVLPPGGSTCAAPIQAPERFAALTVWTVPVVPASSARVRVRPAGAPALSAALRPVAGEGQFAYQAARAVLPRPLGPGRVTVCVSWPGPGRLTLGGTSPTQLAMVFDAPRPRSLLSELPDAFARAALFHPGWVGAWTFWALLAALLAGLLLVIAATARSLSAARRSSGSAR